jgi:hypothetical protein
MGAIIGAQAVGGAAGLYQAKKEQEAVARENEKTRAHEMAKLAEQEQQNIRTYDRTHQDFLPRSPSTSGGLLTQAPPAPSAPGSDYYNQYLNMYKGGVR